MVMKIGGSSGFGVEEGGEEVLEIFLNMGFC